MASDEWKTIRVPKEDYEDAKVRKEEHEVTWGDYINPHRWNSVFDEPKSVPDGEPYAEVAVDLDADTVRSVVSDEIQKHLSEITVNMDMGDLDLDGSELSPEDVEAIVTREIEKTVHERARQL